MNAIEVRGLCKKYKGGFKLNDVSFTLPCGCIMGLIGENGAGKSTAIKLILDMLDADSGTVSLLGKDTAEEKTLAKDDIGVVVDTPAFSDVMTAVQINSIMKYTYSRWDEEQFFSLLERFGIEKKKQFRRFSTGMKMKLGLAVALAHDARLLILDEPTNGLDPVVRKEIVGMFNDFTRRPDNSVLISSHIVSDLEKLCDYVAFMKKGRLILCEEKDRLLEKYGIIHCSAEELEQLPSDAVKSKHQTQYGAEAIVERSYIT
ncbi:MAG: ABC transporter ATP-binding protein, partial [Clostridia bacterium]|nr:ABC transporter ATP-binding protein [Clostridia bacterium]